MGAGKKKYTTSTNTEGSVSVLTTIQTFSNLVSVGQLRTRSTQTEEEGQNIGIHLQYER